jgi:hypothetical protein
VCFLMMSYKNRFTEKWCRTKKIMSLEVWGGDGPTRSCRYGEGMDYLWGSPVCSDLGVPNQNQCPEPTWRFSRGEGMVMGWLAELRDSGGDKRALRTPHLRNPTAERSPQLRPYQGARPSCAVPECGL